MGTQTQPAADIKHTKTKQYDKTHTKKKQKETHRTFLSGGGASGRGGGSFLTRPPLDPRAPNAFFRVPPNVDSISMVRGAENSETKRKNSSSGAKSERKENGYIAHTFLENR